MKATARHFNGRHRHEVEIGLAGCSTLTMETYAKREEWDIGGVAVEVDHEVAQLELTLPRGAGRGTPTP